MPFASKHGGWVEKYNKGEISMCRGWQMPYRKDNPYTYHVWYTGSFNELERRPNEGEEMWWRVQTHDFDDDKWEWFFSPEMKKTWGPKECKYFEDPNDIICTLQQLSDVAEKFQFPIWVLDYMVTNGMIKNQNLISMIEMRKQSEKNQGAVTHTIKERDASTNKISEFRKAQGQKKKSEVADLLNPIKKEVTGAKKKKEKALV